MAHKHTEKQMTLSHNLTQKLSLHPPPQKKEELQAETSAAYKQNQNHSKLHCPDNSSVQ